MIHPSSKARIRRYAQLRFHPKDIAALTGHPVDVVRQVLSAKTLRAERTSREAKRREELERKRAKREKLLAEPPSRDRDRQVRMIETMSTILAMQPAGVAKRAERFGGVA